MVQYQPQVGQNHHPQHYWKLQNWHSRSHVLWSNHQHDALPFFAPKNATMARLAQLASRHERGMLNYESCKQGELRCFLLQRGLGHMSGQKVDKADLVKRLEKADEEDVFAKFGDLPAELRVRVYEFAFEFYEIREAKGALPSPPMSRTSRLMRKESLPVFYGKQRVGIGVLLHGDMRGSLLRSSEGLFKHATPATFAAIEKLRIEILGEGGGAVWEVDLARRGKGYELKKPEVDEKDNGTEEILQEQKKRLKGFLNETKRRHCGMVLRKGDGERLLDALWK